MRNTIHVKWIAPLLVMGLVLTGCSGTGDLPDTTAAASISTSSSVETDEEDSSDSTKSGTDSTAEYAAVFEKDSVIDINIEVSDENWAAILADPMAEEYVSADVTVDGTTVSDVGIRAKGNSSLMSVANSDSDRYSLRVKFDKYVDGQSLLGLDELVLNNCFSDPSYMREYLTYEAFSELGSDTPLTVYANIYINGELFGFYLCVEDVGDSFLAREFDNDDGNLYKAGQGSTLSADSAIDSFSLKTGDDESLSGIQELVDILDAMPAGEKGDIESILDVDSVLKYFAVNTVLGSYDSYLGGFSQNYYLYESDGVSTMIPWDYNMSFGGFSSDNGTSTTIPIDEPVQGVTLASRPLAAKLLAVDEYLQKYHDYIETVTAYLSGMESRTAALADIIRPYVAADPNAFYTIAEFEDAIILHDDTEEAASDTTVPITTSDEAAQTTTSDASVPSSSGDSTMPEPPSGTDGGIGTGPAPGDVPGDGSGFSPDGNTDGFPAGGPGGNAGGGQGGFGGQSLDMIPVSILDYAADRLLNITQQLAGDLPTTGNTTAVNADTNPVK